MTDCLEYRGPSNGRGYGKVRGKYVHRRIVEMAGEDQYGTQWDTSLHVMHECDNPACFRFDHLKLGTHQDNMADRDRKGRLNPGHLQGEAHGCSKLTADQVLTIRGLIAGGRSHRSLGREYGVTTTAIWNIAHRKSWRHL